MDISNGENLGVSIFVQGCRFQCKNCFNKETWDFNGGKEWTNEVKDKFFELIDKPYIKRVSILGGEPLADENSEDVLSLIREVKEKFPTKDIWLYTGYTLEEIFKKYCNQQVYNYFTNIVESNIWCNIQYVDVLVDGRYIDALKDLTLKFRGSSNQRLIDVKETLKQGKIILWYD